MQKADVIQNKTVLTFNLKDRLRILFGGKCHIQISIETDVPIINVKKTTASSFVSKPSLIPQPQTAQNSIMSSC